MPSDCLPSSSPSFQLRPHPQDARGLARNLHIHATCALNQYGAWQWCYCIEGEVSGVVWPQPQAAVAQDGLWQHTCFELFVAESATADSAVKANTVKAYTEFNFSPAGAWAVYRFRDYREREAAWSEAERDALAPQIHSEHGTDRVSVWVTLPQAALPRAPWVRLGISAVLEMEDGTTHYWALQHPAAQPDFHHPEAFAAQLHCAPDGTYMWTR